jgi:hypothetical protein
MSPRPRVLFTAAVYHEDFERDPVTINVTDRLTAGFACFVFCQKATIPYDPAMGVFACGPSDEILDDDEVAWIPPRTNLAHVRFPDQSQPILVVRTISDRQYQSNIDSARQGPVRLIAHADTPDSPPFEVSVAQSRHVHDIRFQCQEQLPIRPFRAVLARNSEGAFEEVPGQKPIWSREWSDGQEIV